MADAPVREPQTVVAGPAPPANAHRRSGWPVALGALITIAGAVGFVVAFVVDADNQWLGGTLGAAFLGLALALSYWGRDLVGPEDQEAVGRYPIPPDDAEEREVLGDELHRQASLFTRRRLLTGLLVSGAAIFGLSQLALVGAFGSRPRGRLFHTHWTPGARLVTIDGRPVTRDALAAGGFLVAFPEGHTDAGDSQVALLRLPGRFTPLPGRESWSPDGFLAFSRVCTHAGCAVSQYEDQAQVLLCPCHQSTFDVLRGARPVSGPAARPLPQLPLAIDGNGFLVAQSDFKEPIGPGFWNVYA
jgi:ubiquinol-cytochrome c reductase iron-sulfur subunit